MPRNKEEDIIEDKQEGIVQVVTNEQLINLKLDKILELLSKN